LSIDFSILFFLVTVIASSSSNPPLSSTMVSGDDPQNPTTDIEIIGAGTNDGTSVDPSRFSHVPENDRENFAFPLFDPWYDNGSNFSYLPNEAPPLPSTGNGC
jgi:hypothetical protein